MFIEKNSLLNVLDYVPSDGLRILFAVAEGCLISKFPNAVQNSFDKEKQYAKLLLPRAAKLVEKYHRSVGKRRSS